MFELSYGKPAGGAVAPIKPSGLQDGARPACRQQGRGLSIERLPSQSPLPLEGADRRERGRQHRALYVGLCESSGLQFGASDVNDRSNDGDQPRGGDIASEDAFGLASLKQRDDLRCHREVSAAQFLAPRAGSC